MKLHQSGILEQEQSSQIGTLRSTPWWTSRMHLGTANPVADPHPGIDPSPLLKQTEQGFARVVENVKYVIEGRNVNALASHRQVLSNDSPDNSLTSPTKTDEADQMTQSYVSTANDSSPTIYKPAMIGSHFKML